MSIQHFHIQRGDNQLISTPHNQSCELVCRRGQAVVKNDRQSMHWPLRTGTHLRLRPGMVYRLDAKTPVAVELRAVGAPGPEVSPSFI